MSIFKISYDYENFLSFHIDPIEMAEKMPTMRPRFLGTSKSDEWVSPNASFYASQHCATQEKPDITTWAIGNLILSPKAYELLKQTLQDFGEFLPAIVEGETYYIFNTLNIISDDAINLDNAYEKIDTGVHVGAENVSFDESLMKANEVFKTPTDKKVNSYCTDSFVALISQHNLKGLRFEQYS